jgi:hypothetical protein
MFAKLKDKPVTAERAFAIISKAHSWSGDEKKCSFSISFDKEGYDKTFLIIRNEIDDLRRFLKENKINFIEKKGEACGDPVTFSFNQSKNSLMDRLDATTKEQTPQTNALN